MPSYDAAANITAAAIAVGFALAQFTLVDRHVLRSRTRWYTPRRGKLWCGFAYGLLIVGVLGGLLIQRLRLN